MIVLDASATVDLLLASQRGRHVIARLRGADGSLQAPHLLSVEVAHALRRLVAERTIGVARGELALRTLGHLRIHRWAHEPLLGRMWQLRHSVSSYDACYVALAEALDATLLTADGRLARSSGHQARIELVND
ncbi:MAG: type II toxin-antitoxin system VapC family toxin [Actinomycetes bacterium]